MYTSLKTIVYQQTPNKQCIPSYIIELFNMEDIIPMLILILLLTDIDNIKNQIDVMVDFISFDPCDLQT